MAKTEQGTKTGLPLTREELRMVSEFRKYRDIYKGAEKAGIPKNRAVKTFNKPEFQEELDRQDEVVRLERAKQQVAAEALTNELIDHELAAMVKLDAKEHGSLKLDAIRTALVVNGRIQSGTMRSLEVGAARPDDEGDAVKQGNVYRALFQVQPQSAAPLMPEEPASQQAGKSASQSAAADEPADQSANKTAARFRTGPLKVG